MGKDELRSWPGIMVFHVGQKVLLWWWVCPLIMFIGEFGLECKYRNGYLGNSKH